MPASILNHVIGPVMPGSSSSHTAGPYHIARVFRSMARELPKAISFTFEPGSSIAECYHEQGSDLALIMGILDLPLTDVRFKKAFEIYPSFGIDIKFNVESFPESGHPNSIKIEAQMADGTCLFAVADSTGGGSVLFRKINGWDTAITADAYYLAVEATSDAPLSVMSELGSVSKQAKEDRHFFLLTSSCHISSHVMSKISGMPDVFDVRQIEPVFFPIRGKRLFGSAKEMLAFAGERGLTLGQAALEYESALLGIPKETLDREMDRRLQVMIDAVSLGLSEECPKMLLLEPKAAGIIKAESEGRLAVGGILTRAAARAMAAMQVNSGQGIVCAAPTGGSAGVIPGIMVTLLSDLKLSRDTVMRAMWAAGAAGWVLAERGTFAAEVCGCQVEIGAAGAMGSAAVVEAFGGSAKQAADAAAIMFQNGMGLVCDLVQTIVEVPCHTRNASFAASAFICADLILGGYHNEVHLDDTIDAVYAVGKMMPLELRCTSLGGMAIAPSAIAMKRRR